MGFKGVIDCWPSKKELAEDLGVPEHRVWKWRQRNSIPPEHWVDLVAAAERREIPGIDADILSLYSRERLKSKNNDSHNPPPDAA